MYFTDTGISGEWTSILMINCECVCVYVFISQVVLN